MLVMLRRRGETIVIGEDVEIRILSIHKARVKVGITAPRSVPVVARELDLVRNENREAAQGPAEVPDAVVEFLQATWKQKAPKNPTKWPI